MTWPTTREHHPTALVTGATAGIGRAIAEGLAQRGFRVVLACRSRGRGLEAADAIERDTGSPCELLLVDLSDRASIRHAAEQLLARRVRLDVLVNDAAVWSVRREVTSEGIERTWAVNVLGYHLLTRLLEPALARPSRGPSARVVMVASGLAHSLDLEDPCFERRPYAGLAAYAQSKQCSRMLTRAFARRVGSAGITVNAMHPGFTRTGAFAAGGGVQGAVAGLGAWLFGKSPARAADTALWLATSPEVEGVTGGYFQDRQELPCAFVDEAAEDALYALCERMTEDARAARVGRAA